MAREARQDPYALRRGERFARTAAERRSAARRRGWLVTGVISLVFASGAAVAVAVTRDHGASKARDVGGRPASPAPQQPGKPKAAPLAPSPATPARPLAGKTIVIDPGHNGGNYRHTAEINRLVDAGTLEKPCDATGAQTASGYAESAYNLDVSLRLAAILRAAGARVVLTRTTDTGWGPCITERAAVGNRAHAAVAISIHADGGPTTGRGFHVIYPPSIPGLTDDIAAASYRLALDVRRTFAAGTGMPYSTYAGHEALDARSDLGGLNLSDVPKVFIETGNMRNAVDAALLGAPSFRQREARALAEALEAFVAAR